jgi:RpiB/LacA/LacB family sugar-phosphate isomerase
MKIGISSDRGGHGIVEYLRSRFSQAHELLIESQAADNEQDYHAAVSRLCAHLSRRRIERAILICSRALGASMAANKLVGVHAALCHEVSSVRLAVQEHDMNCLVIDSGSVTLDLGCSMADTFCDETPAQRPVAYGILARNVASVVAHIRTNLHRPLDVNKLSELAAMSPSHFSKLFKISMGVSPHQFILLERVDRSKQLLRDSSSKIVDIAFAVGFETQAHFTTVFGNLVGMTPMQFRRISAESSGQGRGLLHVGRTRLPRNAGDDGYGRNHSIPMSFPGFERTRSASMWSSQ